VQLHHSTSEPSQSTQVVTVEQKRLVYKLYARLTPKNNHLVSNLAKTMPSMFDTADFIIFQNSEVDPTKIKKVKRTEYLMLFKS
jgi:hypothetical protein